MSMEERSLTWLSLGSIDQSSNKENDGTAGNKQKGSKAALKDTSSTCNDREYNSFRIRGRKLRSDAQEEEGPRVSLSSAVTYATASNLSHSPSSVISSSDGFEDEHDYLVQQLAELDCLDPTTDLTAFLRPKLSRRQMSIVDLDPDELTSGRLATLAGTWAKSEGERTLQVDEEEVVGKRDEEEQVHMESAEVEDVDEESATEEKVAIEVEAVENEDEKENSDEEDERREEEVEDAEAEVVASEEEDHDEKDLTVAKAKIADEESVVEAQNVEDVSCVEITVIASSKPECGVAGNEREGSNEEMEQPCAASSDHQEEEEEGELETTEKVLNDKSKAKDTSGDVEHADLVESDRSNDTAEEVVVSKPKRRAKRVAKRKPKPVTRVSEGYSAREVVESSSTSVHKDEPEQHGEDVQPMTENESSLELSLESVGQLDEDGDILPSKEEDAVVDISIKLSKSLSLHADKSIEVSALHATGTQHYEVSDIKETSTVYSPAKSIEIEPQESLLEAIPTRTSIESIDAIELPSQGSEPQESTHESVIDKTQDAQVASLVSDSVHESNSSSQSEEDPPRKSISSSIESADISLTADSEISATPIEVETEETKDVELSKTKGKKGTGKKTRRVAKRKGKAKVIMPIENEPEQQPTVNEKRVSITKSIERSQRNPTKEPSISSESDEVSGDESRVDDVVADAVSEDAREDTQDDDEELPSIEIPDIPPLPLSIPFPVPPPCTPPTFTPRLPSIEEEIPISPLPQPAKVVEGPHTPVVSPPRSMSNRSRRNVSSRPKAARKIPVPIIPSLPTKAKEPLRVQLPTYMQTSFVDRSNMFDDSMARNVESTESEDSNSTLATSLSVAGDEADADAKARSAWKRYTAELRTELAELPDMEGMDAEGDETEAATMIEMLNKEIRGPNAECFWVIPDRLMVGGYPGCRTDAKRERTIVSAIIKQGVTTFLNLGSNASQYAILKLDFWSYRTTCKKLKQWKDLSFLAYPVSGDVRIGEEVLLGLSRQLVTLLKSGEVVYIHGDEGHPVVCALAACVLGMLYPKEAEHVLERIDAYLRATQLFSAFTDGESYAEALRSRVRSVLSSPAKWMA